MRQTAGLIMARLLGLILTEIVVGHVAKAKPAREDQAQSPGQDDAPENPIRYAEDQSHVRGRSPITKEITDDHAPDQTRNPDSHDEQPFPPGMAEELLFFILRLVGVRHIEP